MKLDIKSIIILVLLLASGIFFYMWFFGGMDGYKKEVNRLREENKKLELQSDSIKGRIKKYELDFVELRKQDSLLKVKILQSQSEVEIAKSKANRSKEELDKLRVELEKTQKQIEELKSHPKNRTGDDLLNSLKNKTNK